MKGDERTGSAVEREPQHLARTGASFDRGGPALSGKVAKSRGGLRLFFMTS